MRSKAIPRRETTGSIQCVGGSISQMPLKPLVVIVK